MDERARCLAIVESWLGDDLTGFVMAGAIDEHDARVARKVVQGIATAIRSSADKQEQSSDLEGDIRIAIWNGARVAGLSQVWAQAVISNAMADPVMQRALSLPRSEEWRVISTAPKDGTYFWAFWPVQFLEDQQRATCWDRDVFGDARWMDASDHIDWCQPTHWRLLPAPPALTTGGAK